MNALFALQHATTITFSPVFNTGEISNKCNIFRGTGAFLKGKRVSSIMKIRCVLTQILSSVQRFLFNPLNAELNPICKLLALLRAHHILHVSGVRVK
jgi:hypothetical protein